MKLGSLGAGVAALAGAVLSSLCCLLPLTVIALGLGSGAFMAVTMQYRWILIPTGVLGVGVALPCTPGNGTGAMHWPAAWREAGLPWLCWSWRASSW